MKKGVIVAAMMAVVLLASASVQADLTAEQRMAQLEERIAQLETQLAGDGSATGEMRNDASGRSDDWLNNFKLFGDLRLRFNAICYNEKRTPDKSERFGQFRVRFGMEKTWDDEQLKIVIRLATGGTSTATDENGTFNNNFEKKSIWIDQAYAVYAPNCLPGLTIVGGKMPKPWVHTDMVWDADLQPEGLWAEYRRELGPLEAFFGMGLFALTHQATSHDATIHAYTAGIVWEVAEGVEWTSAATYYAYAHYADDNFAAGGGIGAGNNNLNGSGDLAAGDFNIINLTNKVKFNAFGMPMNAVLDFAHNCANDNGGQSDAFGFGGGVGENKVKGDWSVNYMYKYIQADSLPGQFNDGTFGGVNRRGHTVCGRYNITDYLTAAASLYYTQPIANQPGADGSDNTTTTLLIDLMWSF